MGDIGRVSTPVSFASSDAISLNCYDTAVEYSSLQASSVTRAPERWNLEVALNSPGYVSWSVRGPPVLVRRSRDAGMELSHRAARPLSNNFSTVFR
jgi:hypothetical protein